jgi:hypothetical protein
MERRRGEKDGDNISAFSSTTFLMSMKGRLDQ